MSGASRAEAHQLSEEAITVFEKPTVARKRRLSPRLRRFALAAHVTVFVGYVRKNHDCARNEIKIRPV